MELFNYWQTNLLGYLITVVGFYQSYKLAVKNSQNDGASTILLQFLGAFSALLLALLFKWHFPTDWRWYGLLMAASLFYAVNDRLQTTVRKHLPVSVFAIVGQLSTVFLILIGFLIFQEPFSLVKIVGVLLILIANILLRYSKGKLVANRYVWLAVLASFVFAVAISIDIGISQQFNLPFYIFLTLFIPALFIYIAEKIKLQAILVEFNGSAKRYYWQTGIFWALCIFFSLRAFQLGEVTTIVPLQAVSVLLNVIFAHIFLRERQELFKKIGAAILVIFGVWFTIL